MKALELTKDYWNAVAESELEAAFPKLFPRLAVGLAGNGSECFGYDDEQSMDHDWGVDFFIWVPEDERGNIPALQTWKEDLFSRRPPQYIRKRSELGGMVGVMTTGDFYRSLIGSPAAPADVLEWRRAPEENYAMAVNGEVFRDGAGEFTSVRNSLLAYYPEDLRKKKIAARCMALAQTGQYNFERVARREDWVTVRTVLAKFTQEAMGLAYHLSRVYRPYYKWTWRKLKELPVMGGRLAEMLRELACMGGLDRGSRILQQKIIDRICNMFAEELRRQKLSASQDWFLAEHGTAVQRTIRNELLRSLPPQYE